MTTDLLESEHLSGKRTALQLEPTSLAALVQEVVDELKWAQPEPGATASLATPRFVSSAKTNLPQIAVDRFRMLLLRNLLDDAVRHSAVVNDASEPKGLWIENPALIEIGLTHLNLTREGNHLRLSVRDHGISVAQSQLPILSSPFAEPMKAASSAQTA